MFCFDSANQLLPRLKKTHQKNPLWSPGDESWPHHVTARRTRGASQSERVTEIERLFPQLAGSAAAARGVR